MMRYAILLTPFFLAAQLSIPDEKEPAKQAVAAAATKGQSNFSNVLIVEPEARSKDLASAFAFLKKASPATKTTVKLSNGDEIGDILSIDPMEGGTLVIFKINTMQGVKYRVEKIEAIDGVEQQ